MYVQPEIMPAAAVVYEVRLGDADDRVELARYLSTFLPLSFAFAFSALFLFLLFPCFLFLSPISDSLQ